MTSSFAKVEQSLRAQSIIMTLARVLRTVLTIGIPIVLVRVLDQETFGAYKQIGLLASTALVVLNFGLPASLYYFVPRMPERSQTFMVQTALVFSIVSVAAGVALALGGAVLARIFGPQAAEYSVWLGTMVALSITAMLDVAMVVDRRVRLAAAVSAVLDATHGLLIIATALVTRNLHWILAAASLSLALRVVVLALYIRWRGQITPTVVGGNTLIEQCRYALPYYGAELIELACDQFHAYYVAAKYDAAQFALYAVGTMQLPIIGHLMHSVGETIVLDGSKTYAAGNLQEMRRVWRRATYMLALVLMPLFFVLEVFARDIIEILFGVSYSASADVFRVFIITMPLSILLGSTLLRATGDLKQIMGANTIALLVTVGTLTLTGDWLGVVAAAWSVVLGNLALTAIVTYWILKRLKVAFGEYLEWRDIFFVMVAAFGSAVIGYYVTAFLPQWMRIFVGPGAAGVSYFAVIWFLKLIPEAERKLIIEFWSQVKVYFRKA